MNLPYALQLSHGWTRIGLAINTVFIVTLVPAIVLMTRHYGAAGAASVWLGLNAIYMIIGVPLTHRRLLKGEAFRWFAKDVGVPLAGTLVIAGSARMIFPVFESSSRFLAGFASAAGLRVYRCRCRHVHSGDERFPVPFHPQQETTRGARLMKSSRDTRQEYSTKRPRCTGTRT